MIFVIMGMEVHPFDRLARAVDELARQKTDDFFIQLGSCTYQPQHARFEKFLSFGQVVENIDRADAVITHAGAGSTLVCLQQGKHPIMVPRRSKHREHIDEHQVPFAEKLSSGGLATMVTEMEQLPAAIAAAKGKVAGSVGHAGELTRYLEGFWQSLKR